VTETASRRPAAAGRRRLALARARTGRSTGWGPQEAVSGRPPLAVAVVAAAAAARLCRVNSRCNLLGAASKVSERSMKAEKGHLGGVVCLPSSLNRRA
jgi:hypothetical protein